MTVVLGRPLPGKALEVMPVLPILGRLIGGNVCSGQSN
jgi:hypothetical protein